jgi:hypothetical protein
MPNTQLRDNRHLFEEFVAMSSDLSGPGQRPTPLLPKRLLAANLGVSTRTIERWRDTGILPQSFRVNGREYWPNGTRPKFDDEKPAARDATQDAA